QAFEQPTMLGKDADNLSHLCFDPREPLGCLAFKLQVATFKLQVATFKLQVGPVGFRHATEERRLVLNQRCHRFFKPILAFLGCTFSCQGRLRKENGAIHHLQMNLPTVSGRLDSNQRPPEPPHSGGSGQESRKDKPFLSLRIPYFPWRSPLPCWD